jgi:3'-phosphoadenosine 5'-phosphosulfate sulfotransferase (PAPS reductase)/FAD synthetase
MTDNELMLFDRLEVIRKTNELYDLENNAYISFSGGKDSTVLHYLMDEALPGNHIPRVFINTGIEYNLIVDFVRKMALNDDRFQMVFPRKKIKETLDEVGYPFKSKEHSTKLYEWQKGHRNTKSNIEYREGNGKWRCPEILKYQFTDEFDLKVSPYCCHELKKKPAKKYQKESGRSITITGMQKAEGGQRVNLRCIVTKAGKATKFHPLAVVNDEWEQWYIEERKIQLCKLYYAPYNFNRTGCKGCPFVLNLQTQLDFIEMYLPNERKQCEYIWAPVYAEYRRLGYRLRKDDGQINLFEWRNNVNDI